MKFFVNLKEIFGDDTIAMGITLKGDTVSIVISSPGTDKKDLPAISLNGSITEIDEKFFDALKEPMKKINTIISNLDKIEKSAAAKQADKATKKETAAKKPKKEENEKEEGDNDNEEFAF